MKSTLAPFARPLYVMSKPIGSACNLACDYCYYLEKSHLYKQNPKQVMSDELLEKFIQEKLENFHSLNQNNLKEIIDEYIEEYIKNNVGQIDALDEYSKYILKRILELLLELVPLICTELSNSNFKPIEYEYDLNNDEIEPISLNGNEGSVRIHGVVDRFDMLKLEDNEYIRIVDYKTGVKKIKLSDILYGLNLQMFILYSNHIMNLIFLLCVPQIYEHIYHWLFVSVNVLMQ